MKNSGKNLEKNTKQETNTLNQVNIIIMETTNMRRHNGTRNY